MIQNFLNYSNPKKREQQDSSIKKLEKIITIQVTTIINREIILNQIKRVVTTITLIIKVNNISKIKRKVSEPLKIKRTY